MRLIKKHASQNLCHLLHRRNINAIEDAATQVFHSNSITNWIKECIFKLKKDFRMQQLWSPHYDLVLHNRAYYLCFISYSLMFHRQIYTLFRHTGIGFISSKKHCYFWTHAASFLCFAVDQFHFCFVVVVGEHMRLENVNSKSSNTKR